MLARFRLPALSILAGIMLGIGFRVSVLWPLSLFSFFFVLLVLTRTRSLRGALGFGNLIGFSAYCIGFHAMYWDALPLTWLGIHGVLAILLIALAWGIAVISYAVPFAAFFALAFFLKRDSWLDLLIVPAAYTLAGWVGGWLYSIVNSGPGSLLGDNFGSLGWQLAGNGALLQIAWLGGIYALVFCQALIGAVLYRLWRTNHSGERRILLSISALALVAGALGSWWLAYGTAPQGAKPLSIALVTHWEPAVVAPSSAQLAASFVNTENEIAGIASSTAFIVLPEDSRFLETWHAARSLETTLPLPHGPVVIDSATELESGTRYSRVEYYDTTANTSAYTYKQYLMPFGEYLPTLYRVLGSALGQGALIENLSAVRAFSTKDDWHPVELNGTPVAALLCSEAMSASLYADEARDGAQLFVNLSSHSWFHRSHMLYTLALWSARVRAVESRRWYARAADDTPSFVLDPYGRVTAESAWGADGVLRATVYPRTDATPYLLFGPWVLYAAALILLLAGTARVHKTH